jgi:translation initiation factor IF-2
MFLPLRSCFSALCGNLKNVSEVLRAQAPPSTGRVLHQRPLSRGESGGTLQQVIDANGLGDVCWRHLQCWRSRSSVGALDKVLRGNSAGSSLPPARGAAEAALKLPARFESYASSLVRHTRVSSHFADAKLLQHGYGTSFGTAVGRGAFQRSASRTLRSLQQRLGRPHEKPRRQRESLFTDDSKCLRIVSSRAQGSVEVRGPRIPSLWQVQLQRRVQCQWRSPSRSTALCARYIRHLGISATKAGPVEHIVDAAKTPATKTWLRPPIVTVMGHVNHGKTTLLDALRETQLAGEEAGGITQNIRAFRVFWERILGQSADVPSVPWITFLDTPGHEAFTEMRARGASVTDIVVLVIAADDGVMPQTLEAIHHARAAAVPIIVALNKCDKIKGRGMAIYKALEEQAGLCVEALGGDVQCVEISALKRLHLDRLVEAILLQAAVLEAERTTSIQGAAEGVCLEARMDRGYGLVLDCLFRHGKLCSGDILATPAAWGRVRLLLDEHGRKIQEAWPTQPVTVIGVRRNEDDSEIPVEPGSIVRTVDSEEAAKAFVRSERSTAALETPASTAARGSEATRSGTAHTTGLELIIRGTYRGTVEAVAQAVQRMSTPNFPIHIMLASTGAVCKADILLASSSLDRPAQIIAFQTKVPRAIAELAARHHVPVKCFTVIYEILDDIQQQQRRAQSDEPQAPVATGRARVQQVFTYNAGKRVADALIIGGCRVIDGVIYKRHPVRILRQGQCVHEARISSLKHYREDVAQVRKGQECGIAVEGFAFAVDDEIIGIADSG